VRILLSGASGFIGSRLAERLQRSGHDIQRLVRPASGRAASGIPWDPDRGLLEPESIEGFDAVIHLAGRNVGTRWSRTVKRDIRQSRIGGTSLLAGTLACLRRPPEALLCASAIGYYGDRGSERLTEKSPVGEGFLAGVVKDWEEAARPAAHASIRVVHVRLGLVLDPGGGALARLLPLFRAGLGARLGDGRQHMSWITLPDVLDVFEALLTPGRLSGPVNATAPHPVTNREFTAALARTLRRPAPWSLPAALLEVVLGEMARESLLASARAEPEALLRTGYHFRQSEIELALRSMLQGS
jgi:uncharacterized protein (TIGR01777 family)